MTTYHQMITPPTYLAPFDNYGHPTQQFPQHSQSHFSSSFIVPAPSNSINNYSYPSQNAIPQGPAITALPSAYMQPHQHIHQPQSQRLTSLAQASRHPSYPSSDINPPLYGPNNYQYPYPRKSNLSNSNYNPVGSYNVNGTTFYLPNASVDRIDYLPRHQRQSYNINDSAVSGGVSAKLDYNLDEMSQFIASKALEIMGKRPGISKIELSGPSFIDSFKKFTFQVLAATRLPRSTLILSLVYLSDRWSKGSIPKTSSAIHDVYKMLVVALLLANKFHDDNTFTNKSWNEATGVPIADLGLIESDWLRTIQWTLHLEKSQGWDEWNQVYEYWISNNRKHSSSPYRSPYSPVVSHNSYPLSPLPSPESSSIPTDKTCQLYPSPPPLQYVSYGSKWYPNNVAHYNSITDNSSSVSVSATHSRFSSSSSISTLPTPPSTYTDSYLPPYFRQQSHNNCNYDDAYYTRQNSISSSHYVASFGSTGCSCSDCSFDTMPKVPTWGYNYAAAC